MNNRLEIAREFANAIQSDDIVKIILFGSVARGDDTEESDIDILIVTSGSDELPDEINSIAVDIILEKDVKNSFANTYYSCHYPITSSIVLSSSVMLFATTKYFSMPPRTKPMPFISPSIYIKPFQKPLTL